MGVSNFWCASICRGVWSVLLNAIFEGLPRWKKLKVWVVVCALLALVLIGPVGLTTVRGVLSRLRKITQAMIQLANNDTSVKIPSHEDADEVGEMARTVEGFKKNAVQLITREGELATAKHRFDA